MSATHRLCMLAAMLLLGACVALFVKASLRGKCGLGRSGPGI